MLKYLRHCDFILMFLLVISEFTSLILYGVIMIMTVGLEDKRDSMRNQFLMNLLNTFLCIALEISSLWIIIICGIHSLYFKILTRLVWYIICSLVIPVLIWIIFLIDQLYGLGTTMKPIHPSTLSVILDLKGIVNYISIAKSFFYILTFFITIIERKNLKNDIEQTPLGRIDEHLTEDLYKNIINQSKNPDDANLVQEYQEIQRQSQVKRKTRGSENQLNESATDSNHQVKDSINENPQKSGGS